MNCVVGMFQKHKNQVRENCEIVRESWAQRPGDASAPRPARLRLCRPAQLCRFFAG
jgi:hypothetical protein